MYRLPLFPLHTVLFPGTPLTLHIFEPRYRLMIEQCLQTGQPFGVVLIREGREALGPLAQPHPVGCTAQITDVERLPNGHMNIVAVGRERFHIVELSYDRPYLMGTVEPFPLVDPEGPDTLSAAQQLRPWVERYLVTLSRALHSDSLDPAALPDDPLALGYFAAALVQIPADQKQSLLTIRRAAQFLSAMRDVYRRETALLDVILERDPALTRGEGFFSAN
ncbi:MAG: LON peptidase substrate-binding domain-containing protein [Anaerolineae bacterium]